MYLNKLILCFVIPMWQVFGTFLTYATGSVSAVGSTCVGSSVKQINFPGSFARKPQFLAYIRYFEISVGGADFNYTVTQLTETMCEITIECQSSQIQQMFYYWLAFDDPRITTLSSGYRNVEGQTSQIFTLNHNNVLATQGFVMFQAFGYPTNSIDITLMVTSVTSSSVIVEYTSYSTIYLSIGFQVVIGSAEAFILTTIQESPSITQYLPISSVIDTVEDHILLVPINHVQWSQSNTAFRYGLTITNQTTTYKYDLTTRFNTVLKVTYREVWQIMPPLPLYPLLCSRMRISKKQQITSHKLQLYIDELQKTYYSGDSVIENLDNTKLILNIVIQMKCPVRYRIDGYVNKCVDCGKNTYDLSTDCYGGINYVYYGIRLVQQDQVLQQIQVVVTDTSITLSQSVLYPFSPVISLELKKKVRRI